MKPILRWTIGNCANPGFEVLEESICKAFEVFGKDRFDWAICYNTEENDPRIKALRNKWKRIDFIHQTEEYKPIPGSNIRTMWKFAPPRLALTRHEIYLDNDVVIRKPLPSIEEFLRSDKLLMSTGYTRYYGIFNSLVPEKMVLNSGLIGVPPNFNLGTILHKAWKNAERPSLNPDDEQGLIASIVARSPHIITDDVQVLPPQKSHTLQDKAAYHFAGANQEKYHPYWEIYKIENGYTHCKLW